MGSIIDSLCGTTKPRPNSPSSSSENRTTKAPAAKLNVSTIDRSRVICIPMSKNQTRCYLSLSEGQYGKVKRSGEEGPSDGGQSAGDGHSNVMYVWIALCLLVLLTLLCGFICLWKHVKGSHHERGRSYSGSFMKYRRSTSYKLFSSKTRTRRSHSRQSSHNKTKKSHKTERKSSKRSSRKKNK